MSASLAVVENDSINSRGIDSEHRYQQNQWGDSRRIYGASLRWYEIEQQAPLLNLGVSVNTGMRKMWLPELGWRLKFGAWLDVMGLKIKARSGYDRFNSDELWQQSTIDRLHQHAGFVEFNFVMRPEPDKRSLYILFIVGYYHVWYRQDNDLAFKLHTRPALYGGVSFAY